MTPRAAARWTIDAISTAIAHTVLTAVDIADQTMCRFAEQTGDDE